MKLYTKTGDGGTTGLYGADRVSKAHPRVEAYGAVDELNSVLGVVRAHNRAEAQDAGLDGDLNYLQNALYDLGADLSTRTGSPYEKNVSRLDDRDLSDIEGMIDRYMEAAPPIRWFIQPGGTLTAAQLQVARAVARRAERDVIRLMEVEETNHAAQVYLNRLSDLLFAMARVVNHRAGLDEEAAQKGDRRPAGDQNA
ncbi:cob(I)yrinic acid a,c-diamide adenosyltransferase [Deinococcus fonticola]|uniref:cob(I)yrinic acid a,c-diamide adenosyltransferase n=1 Tax=Deinococcus fonticola TaxID=2528713 RepID=UPI001074EF0A|nr:cob(I)yrinic acid a,c-diamide adenosyltransferase [Deinococcus fonticola]